VHLGPMIRDIPTTAKKGEKNRKALSRGETLEGTLKEESGKKVDSIHRKAGKPRSEKECGGYSNAKGP